MMRQTNLRHWDALSKTDPKHTKPFTRPGGFKGTAVRPIWIERHLTETFGPCGIGWGMDKPEFQTVPGPDGEVAVYCTLRCWYRDHDAQSTPAYVWGVGGDKVITKRVDKAGKLLPLIIDDEAFKKSMTDALSNAFKHVGVAADVHMGLFDDAKYVNDLRHEFTEPEPAAPVRQPIVVNGGKASPPPRLAPVRRQPPPQSSNGATELDDGREDALKAYDRLLNAIGTAKSPSEVNDLLFRLLPDGTDEDTDDFKLVAAHNDESADHIIKYAKARKQELRTSE